MNQKLYHDNEHKNDDLSIEQWERRRHDDKEKDEIIVQNSFFFIFHNDFERHCQLRLRQSHTRRWIVDKQKNETRYKENDFEQNIKSQWHFKQSDS